MDTIVKISQNSNTRRIPTAGSGIYSGNGKHLQPAVIAVTVYHELSLDDASNDLSTIEKRLLEKYPLITLDDELGEPRLVGTRFAVANVLSAITFYDDLSQVIEEYDGRYTKEQLTEAIKFARDFLISFYRYESHI